MNREETLKAIKVMQAYVDGKEIESRSNNSEKWITCYKNICWDWACNEYRVKPKVERFDPKTLQPFDKVLVRDETEQSWLASHFSHLSEAHEVHSCSVYGKWVYCIPYNDDTKHLIGTDDEAPEYYRYWEDRV